MKPGRQSSHRREPDPFRITNISSSAWVKITVPPSGTLRDLQLALKYNGTGRVLKFD